MLGAAAAATRGATAAPAQTGSPAASMAPSRSAADTLAGLTLSDVSARIKAGTVTSTELVNACLARIDVYNPKVNAFITVTREQALAQARALDAEQRAGRLRGPLHGIPIALKDNIDTAGVRTTAASAVFDDRVPSEDAEVARRLAPPARSSSAKPISTSSHLAGRPRRATTGRCETRGRSNAILEDRRVARRPPSPPISATARSAPIPAVPSARRRRTAASSD